MLFTDLIFVFGLLPITIFLMFLDTSVYYKNIIIILSTLVVFSWGRPIWVLVLFISSVLDFIFGFIGGQKNKILKAISVVLSLALNLSIIGLSFYLFYKENRGVSELSKLIPVFGIMLYALRGLFYVIGTASNTTKPERNLFLFLTYMLSFQLILGGPFVSYQDIKDELKKREIHLEDLSQGITSFVYGLSKVVIISPVMFKLRVASNETPFGLVVLFLSFVLEFYFVFRGVSDMAVGLGRMTGFHYPKTQASYKFSGGMIVQLKSLTLSGANRVAEIAYFCENHIYLYFLVFPLIIVFLGLSLYFVYPFCAFCLFILLFSLLDMLLISKCFSEKLKPLHIIYGLLAIFVAFIFFCFPEAKDFRFILNALRGFGNSISPIIKEIKSYLFVIVAAVFLASPLSNLSFKLVYKLSEKNSTIYGVMRIAQTVFTALLLMVSALTVFTK